MGLNIKDPKAHRLAKSLSRKTGMSMSKIVVGALEREWAEHRHLATAKKRSEAGLRIAAKMRAALGKARPKLNINDSLYDEHGLPK
jgi:antitoxin VapB